MNARRQALNHNGIHVYPVIGPWCGCVAVSPEVVVFVVLVSAAAQVKPAVAVTGVVGNKVHDQLQS